MQEKITEALEPVDRKTIIKVTSIYLVIAGILGLCGGVGMIGLGGLVGMSAIGGASISAADGSGELAAASLAAGSMGVLSIIVGVFMLLQAPIALVTAYGLFQNKAWSRMGVVIFAGFSVVGHVLSLLNGGGFSELLWIAISGFVGYLYYTDARIRLELSQ